MQPQPETFTHREILTVLSGVVLCMFMAALDQTIVATALPTIASNFGRLEGLSWVVTAYLLTSTATAPLFGKMSDLYGRKRPMQAAVAIFVVGSVFCGSAQSMTQLVLFRGLQGIGGGGLMVLAFTVIADVVAPRERGRYQGYIAGVFAVSSVTGPVLGGFLAEYLSWRLIFLINVPIGLAAYAMISRALARLAKRRQGLEIDYPGAALMVGAIVCLLLALTWGGRAYAWTSPVILGLVGTAVVLLVLLVLQELRASEPILPPRLFRSPIVAVCSLGATLGAAVMFVGIVFMPLHLQLVREVGAGRSGLFMLPLMMGVVVGGTTSGRLVTRTGRYKPWPLLGMILAGGGYATLALAESLGELPYLFVLGVIGVGAGTVMPVTMIVVQNVVERRDLGAATSAVGFFRSLGASLGIALFGTILASGAERGLRTDMAAAAGLDLGSVIDQGPEAIRMLPAAARDAVVAAFGASFDGLFLAAAGMAALTFVVILFLKEVRLRSAHDAPGAAG
ncbi:MAG: MFS transporter [Rhodospirillales bacterium]|nr:MFS transporter [Rhodospirillales bacterium]